MEAGAPLKRDGARFVLCKGRFFSFSERSGLCLKSAEEMPLLGRASTTNRKKMERAFLLF